MRLRSFRDSFESLLRLDDSDLQIVLNEIVRIDGDIDTDEDIPDDLSDAFSALLTLRSIVGEEGKKAVIEDIKTAYPDNPGVARITAHIEPTDSEIESRAIRDSETDTLPIMVGARVSVDFRASTSTGGAIKLVPLFVTRVSFDESSWGSEAVTFQASAYSLTRLRDDINDALKLMESSAKAIGPNLLYTPTVKKYLS